MVKADKRTWGLGYGRTRSRPLRDLGIKQSLVLLNHPATMQRRILKLKVILVSLISQP